MGYTVASNECIIILCALCHMIHFIKPVSRQYFEGKSRLFLNLQGDTQDGGANSEISEFFGRIIPNAILPFPRMQNAIKAQRDNGQ